MILLISPYLSTAAGRMIFLAVAGFHAVGSPCILRTGLIAGRSKQAGSALAEAELTITVAICALLWATFLAVVTIETCLEKTS